jgi:hypothetical protein
LVTTCADRYVEVSKGSINLFAETMTNSIKPLNMLLMLVGSSLPGVRLVTWTYMDHAGCHQLVF